MTNSSFIFDSVFSRYPNLNKHNFWSKSGISKEKKKQTPKKQLVQLASQTVHKYFAWRQPWYFGMPELCVHTPLSSDRILKRYIFKYQDLIQFIILLHQRWSLVSLAFVDSYWNDSSCSWVLLLQQVNPLLFWPISVNISIVKKANNVLVFLWK